MLVEISERMGRKPSALPMKLSNLASIDPEFRKTGRKGLEGASEFDRAMWAEYHANLNELAPEGEALLAQLMTGDADTPIEVLPDGKVLRVPEGPTESTASVKVRRGQRYFQQAVLNAYQGRCAVTGMGIRSLLVASHIIPWSRSEEHRLDPRNGIALTPGQARGAPSTTAPSTAASSPSIPSCGLSAPKHSKTISLTRP